MPLDPICNDEQYPRYEPGNYEVRCISAEVYRDPRFRCWKCRLECHFLTERAVVSGFLNLGTGDKPGAGRGSEYRRVWIMANGAQPKKRQVLSARVFRDKFFGFASAIRNADTTAENTSKQNVTPQSKSFLNALAPSFRVFNLSSYRSGNHRISKSTNQGRHRVTAMRKSSCATCVQEKASALQSLGAGGNGSPKALPKGGVGMATYPATGNF